jgi:hypothetical protein
MKFLEKTKLVANLTIILAGLSITYFFVVFANIQKREMEIKEDNISKFEECVVTAGKEYISQWNFQCKESKKSDLCPSLPGFISSGIEKKLQEDKANCAKLYK